MIEWKHAGNCGVEGYLCMMGNKRCINSRRVYKIYFSAHVLLVMRPVEKRDLKEVWDQNRSRETAEDFSIIQLHQLPVNSMKSVS
jgi:hypothetical protein